MTTCWEQAEAVWCGGEINSYRMRSINERLSKTSNHRKRSQLQALAVQVCSLYLDMTALNREWAELKVIQPMVHCEINSYRMRSTTSGRTKPVVAERDIHSTQFYRKRSVWTLSILLVLLPSVLMSGVGSKFDRDNRSPSPSERSRFERTDSPPREREKDARPRGNGNPKYDQNGHDGGKGDLPARSRDMFDSWVPFFSFSHLSLSLVWIIYLDLKLFEGSFHRS